MSASRKDREEFLLILDRELPNVRRGAVLELGRKLLRLSATHCRLAEAVCNGDYPADNGERETDTCPSCGRGWAKGTVKKNGCPDCRCEASIRAACAPYALEPVFWGDPRGCTVKLRVPSGATNDSPNTGICVPQ